jgi:hypothetical protein
MLRSPNVLDPSSIPGRPPRRAHIQRDGGCVSREGLELIASSMPDGATVGTPARVQGHLPKRSGLRSRSEGLASTSEYEWEYLPYWPR